MAKVMVTKGPNQGTSFSVGPGRATIGRDPGRTVPLLDGKASRLHAEIVRTSVGWQLRDLGSTNRTQVNGRIVAEHMLRPGDVITIGDTDILFEEDSPTDLPAPPVVLDAGGQIPRGVTVEMPQPSLERVLEGAALSPSGADVASRRLRVLWRLSRTAFVKDSLETFLDEVLSLLLSELLADAAVVLVLDESTGRPRTAASRVSDSVGSAPKLVISLTVVDRVLAEGQPLLLSDVTVEGVASNSMKIQKIQSVMCVPLKSPEKTYGVFYVDSRTRGLHYRPEDLGFLATVCAHVAVNIENLALYHEQLAALEELRRTQEQLVSSEKMSVLGRLSGSIAHELNNPLQVISFASEFLSDDLGAAGGELKRDRWLERLQTISHSTERCIQLVRNLLHYSRRTAQVAPEPLPIRGPIEQAVQLMHYMVHRKNVALTAEVPTGLPLIVGNPSELEQVFINLIKNALDAVEAGGKIDVSVRREASWLVAEVADTGTGIAPEVLPRVFEELFTTKPPGEGTGLGLSLCKRIVERTGGRIELQSTLGQGTAVTVRFPVWQAPAEPGGSGEALL
ncbi:MAG: FHA domain-containing protein [Candidatus Riflebacteria bacterium]|nr:FHA domain-containing protein [Candidatus Riflebacteria bacterium]